MTYELINSKTTNTIAEFDSEGDARDALFHLGHEHPSLRGEVVIVAFDDEGMACGLLGVENSAEEAAPGASPGLAV
jgi:hypothetical protein